MIRRVLIASLLAAGLAACASEGGDTGAAAAPERRLERPAGQSAPVPPGLDPGEAALAEGGFDTVAPGQDDASVTVEGNTVTVTGRTRVQAQPLPGEDPRSTGDRAEHIRAWDRCISSQTDFGEAPLSSPNPVAATPEAYCSERLGMASREAIPDSWWVGRR